MGGDKGDESGKGCQGIYTYKGQHGQSERRGSIKDRREVGMARVGESGMGEMETTVLEQQFFKKEAEVGYPEDLIYLMKVATIKNNFNVGEIALY